MAKKFSVWWILIFGLCLVASSLFVFFNTRKNIDDNRIKIVCSTFPIYDWTLHIIGDDSESVTLSMTEKNGINFHSYIPTEIDFKQINNSDLFICVGAEENILSNIELSHDKILNLGKNLEEKNPEKYAVDKNHIWLSVLNAEFFTNIIAEKIIQIDPDNSEKYSKNLVRYINQLETLNDEYQEVFLKSLEQKSKPLIICDRNPFFWLFDDYKIQAFSALDSCSENDYVSEGLEKFIDDEKKTFLIGKINEIDTKFVFKLDNSSNKFANSIIQKSKNPLGDVLTLDTMHSATLSETFKGKSFVKVMRANLDEFKKAL